MRFSFFLSFFLLFAIDRSTSTFLSFFSLNLVETPPPLSRENPHETPRPRLEVPPGLPLPHPRPLCRLLRHRGAPRPALAGRRRRGAPRRDRRVPADDGAAGPRVRPARPVPAGPARGRRGGEGAPPAPRVGPLRAAARVHEAPQPPGHRPAHGRRRLVKVVLDVLPPPAAAVLALRDLRQLRAAVRPPLSLGGAVRRGESSKSLLYIYFVERGGERERLKKQKKHSSLVFPITQNKHPRPATTASSCSSSPPPRPSASRSRSSAGLGWPSSPGAGGPGSRRRTSGPPSAPSPRRWWSPSTASSGSGSSAGSPASTRCWPRRTRRPTSISAARAATGAAAAAAEAVAAAKEQTRLTGAFSETGSRRASRASPRATRRSCRRWRPPRRC